MIVILCLLYAQSYTVQNGVDYPFNDIQEYVGASVGECQNYCDANSECAGFVVMSTPYVSCWLKNALIESKNNANPERITYRKEPKAEQLNVATIPVPAPKPVAIQPKVSQPIQPVPVQPAIPASSNSKAAPVESGTPDTPPVSDGEIPSDSANSGTFVQKNDFTQSSIDSTSPDTSSGILSPKPTSQTNATTPSSSKFPSVPVILATIGGLLFVSGILVLIWLRRRSENHSMVFRDCESSSYYSNRKLLINTAPKIMEEDENISINSSVAFSPFESPISAMSSFYTSRTVSVFTEKIPSVMTATSSLSPSEYCFEQGDFRYVSVVDSICSTQLGEPENI